MDKVRHTTGLKYNGKTLLCECGGELRAWAYMDTPGNDLNPIGALLDKVYCEECGTRTRIDLILTGKSDSRVLRGDFEDVAPLTWEILIERLRKLFGHGWAKLQEQREAAGKALKWWTSPVEDPAPDAGFDFEAGAARRDKAMADLLQLTDDQRERVQAIGELIAVHFNDDLPERFNTTPSEVRETILKALTGQYMGLRRYGIMIYGEPDATPTSRLAIIDAQVSSYRNLTAEDESDIPGYRAGVNFKDTNNGD